MVNFKNIPVIIISAVVIIIAALVFAYKIRKISLPPEYEELTAKGISGDISIFRNDRYIPHAVCKSKSDMFFAMGYCHAQDRLWQMDFARRLGKGRLSEVIGPEFFQTDRLMKTLGMDSLAHYIYTKLSPMSQKMLLNYAKGVNVYLENHANQLPFEFGAMDYTPEQWKAVDCVIIQRLYAWQQSSSFWTDIFYGEIAEKIGVAKAFQLIPGYPDGAPCITDDTTITNFVNPKKSEYIAYNVDSRDSCISALSNISQEYREIRKILKMGGSSAGSNSWALKKKKKDSCSAILACDPHHTLRLPPEWYQIHISSPEMNLIGLTLPGTPLMMAGRNNHIAWGCASMNADDFDYKIEKTDPSDPAFYFDSLGKRKKFDFRKDTVRIKGGEDSVYYCRIAGHSAIISDYHILHAPETIFGAIKDNLKNEFLSKYPLSFNWTATIASDEFLANLMMCKARNWKQFKRAANLWYSPGINFTYADKAGNVGVAPGALIPVRGESCNPNIPNPGWDYSYDWHGFIRPAELPYSYNPAKMYVACANNKLDRNLEYHISSLWEPASRSDRIAELLSESEDYDSREAQLMQMDFLSPYAVKFLSQTLSSIVADSASMNYNQKRALRMLIEWDFIMSSGSPQSSIYSAFLETFLRNTFYDELGESLFRQYMMISNQPYRKIIEILDGENQEWFDDVFTIKIESRKDIILRSFLEAIEKLTETFDDDNIDSWKYGQIHVLNIEHHLSNIKLLEPVLTLGPYPMGGDLTTINNTEWSIYYPFEVKTGASARIICDLADTIVYTSLPGGASGDPLSTHFSDQIQLWLNGGYVEIPVFEEPAKGFILRTKIESAE